MKRLILAAALALSLSATLASPAAAGGSDAPTPYTVTAEGITLPEGVTFPAHGHVNWKTSWAQHGVHFDPNNNQPGGKYIGQSFLPFNLEPGECVTWVQVSMYEPHFGEGGQEPICKPKTEEPPVVTPPTDPPVTDPPTEEPPCTEEPTEPPTTEPPTEEPTEPPVTEPPTTEPPVTQPPTEEPTIEPPTEEPSPTPTTDRPQPQPSLTPSVTTSVIPAVAPSPRSAAPAKASTPTESLAHTGADFTLAIVAGGLVTAGVLALVAVRRRRTN